MNANRLNAAIRLVVDYNWKAERDDFQAQYNAGEEHETGEGHIFSALVALDNWLMGTKLTPISYIDTDERKAINR